MDLHLIVPETPQEEGPPEVIATLRKRLLEFMKEVQELEPSFKLHTINPEAKNIMTLDSPQKSKSLCNQDSIMKYKALRYDQHIWCEHAHR
jgi:hypothetical protein